ncbi:hypothetical protein PV325_013552 [Microctonus aethiopoides]|nr:hypothetical protein PV325_013552 [Microctonus aethiopoides]
MNEEHNDLQTQMKKLEMMRLFFNNLQNKDFINYMQQANSSTPGPFLNPSSIPHAPPPPSIPQAPPPPSFPQAPPPPPPSFPQAPRLPSIPSTSAPPTPPASVPSRPSLMSHGDKRNKYYYIQ